MSLIDWTPSGDELPRVSEGDLDTLALERQVELPEEFRAVLKEHSGQAPDPAICSLEDSETEVGPLFFTRRGDDTDAAHNIWSQLAVLDSHLPRDMSSRLIPFAPDAEQRLFALDYRFGDPPAVVLVDLGQSEETDHVLTVVAPSFGQWLGGLHD